MRRTIGFLLVALSLGVAGPVTAQQVIVGNLVESNSSDGNLGTPRTAIDLANPANLAGNVAEAAFRWSNSACPNGIKIKFFRRSAETLQFLTERGPFSTTNFVQVVALVPPVALQAGDLIGIAKLAECGNATALSPGAPAGYVQVAGDVTTAVDLAAASTVRRPNATLSVRAVGLASEGLASIVPVVGSVAGVPPSVFKTAVHLHNPTASPLTGRLVYHPQGPPGSGGDPSLAFTLASGATRFFADLPAEMGQSGVGSLDVVTPLGGALPVMNVRIFNDGGAAGTTGFTEEPIAPSGALTAGQRGVIVAPPDTLLFRYNIGVRTLEAGVLMTVTVRNAAGTVTNFVVKNLSGNSFEQRDSTSFLGFPLAANDSLTFDISAGAAIIYGATVDNRTQDPSAQFVRRLP